jgi:hypothetical protein
LLQQVIDAIDALPDTAAAGRDGIASAMLKVGLVMAQWLLRVITAVWVSGKAPLDWKRADIVPVYKGKGSAKLPGNHRPISLLSVPGKVYASVVLHRFSKQVDSQLLEGQCAFRKSSGLGDAATILRSVMDKSVQGKQPLCLACVDLSKAFDKIPRQALWRVLSAHGADSKVVELLTDLHTGTQAAVTLAGAHGDYFDISRGVRQGCVLAPLLFTTFFDCVVRLALTEMPDGRGVGLAVGAEGEVLPRQENDGGPRPLPTMATLNYADDLVLTSSDRDELELMLKQFDSVCNTMGLCG